MRPTRISPTDAWDLVEAYSNPVPSDVGAVLGDLDIEVMRTVDSDDSTEYLARCPAHLERTGKIDRRPSFWVNSRTGAFICFSCEYSGPFVQLVMDARKTDRVTAAQWILRHGIRRPNAVEPTPAPEPIRLNEASLALFEPPPPAALAKRRVSAESCAAYGVLWDPRRRYWILPVRDAATGQLLGWQEKGPGHFINYPKGLKKSHTLFGLQAFYEGTAILVESPLDAVLIHTLGITGAVAAYGAYVSDTQIRLIKARCTQLILALDNDSAGISARDTLSARWRPRGLPIRFFDYGEADGKDPGDMRSDQVLRGLRTAHLPSLRKR